MEKICNYVQKFHKLAVEIFDEKISKIDVGDLIFFNLNYQNTS